MAEDSIESKFVNADESVSDIIGINNQFIGNDELGESYLRYFLNEEKRIEVSENLEFNNILNQVINAVIQECEDNISEECLSQDIFETQSADFIDKLLILELTLNNYEEIFCLKGLQKIEIPLVHDKNIRNIRYRDNEGVTHAIVQINSDINRIRLQTFANILPKQIFLTPKEVFEKISNRNKEECWTTEDGGLNHFDGNIEYRYKDSTGKVMAAVITKPNGTIDTIVEYVYIEGKKSQMIHTSQFGQSIIIYNAEQDITRLIIDIDTDGNIFGITSTYY